MKSRYILAYEAVQFCKILWLLHSRLEVRPRRSKQYVPPKYRNYPSDQRIEDHNIHEDRLFDMCIRVCSVTVLRGSAGFP
jgi:hypothetical protein